MAQIHCLNVQVIFRQFLNKKYGINISYVMAGAALEDIGYSKQENQKMLQVGKSRPDRNAQFTCDCGGSNGYRSRLWKYQLSQLSKRIDLEIHVSHFPPGTSKWNKVEHELFCYISKNWQGKPLIDVETVVNLIGSTTTTTGLKVVCLHDDTEYPLAQTVSDEEFESIAIDKIAPFEEWNYKFLLP